MICTPVVCHRGSGDGSDAEGQPQHSPKTRHCSSKARAQRCPVNHPLGIASTSLESHTRKQGQPRTVSCQEKQRGKKGEKHAGQEGQFFHVALGISLERWQVPACSLLPETPIPACPPTPCAPDVTFLPAHHHAAAPRQFPVGSRGAGDG